LDGEDKIYTAKLENTVKCLMGYIMELHDFRNELLSPELKDNLEGIQEHIIMKFPALQGTRNQRMFKELGEDSSWEDVTDVLNSLTDAAKMMKQNKDKE
jgi:hypothetical protein